LSISSNLSRAAVFGGGRTGPKGPVYAASSDADVDATALAAGFGRGGAAAFAATGSTGVTCHTRVAYS
jgi:hypothetical protein